jgi:hypothetical protein
MFIHRIINNFVNEVMQALVMGVSNVHGRPFTHGLQAIQNLDIRCPVTIRIGRARNRPAVLLEFFFGRGG